MSTDVLHHPLALTSMSSGRIGGRGALQSSQLFDSQWPDISVGHYNSADIDSSIASASFDRTSTKPHRNVRSTQAINEGHNNNDGSSSSVQPVVTSDPDRSTSTSSESPSAGPSSSVDPLIFFVTTLSSTNQPVTRLSQSEGDMSGGVLYETSQRHSMRRQPQGPAATSEPRQDWHNPSHPRREKGQ